ncbi:MAG TPA: AAA family ATPase [Candidatus Sulfotelmatobacter sp.]|jgi:general secretion pathway protein A|nr:AAA family ATPase [Candidatus Sulfotelmatobacter sp.]
MFLDFFGLREQPFGVTPDPRYLYLGPAHREALASLYYGIEANRGFLSLIARPGMGKTTLLFHLLAKFDRTARTAFVFQTQCNSREFMRFLLAEIGIESDSQDFVKMHDQFNRCLVQEARAGKRFIVVIDEAQNLDPTVLETVRLLSDFETPQAKLLQIILVGQPGLADKLSSPSLVQLRQRITSVSGLSPLSREETGRFIEHRLKVAGHVGARLFTPEAQELIAQVSEGIPRQINNYCFHSLSLACAMRKKTVDVGMVREVNHDLDITRFVTDVGSPSSRHLGVNVASNDPFHPVEELSGVARDYAASANSASAATKDYLSPAEAIEHMRDVARLLHNWRNGSGKPSN